MIPTRAQQKIWALSSGTVIRVAHGWYHHVALVGDRIINGERSVLDFSAETHGLTERPYSKFACSSEVTIEGYLGKLPPEVVMHRARLKHAERYSWTGFNCEHFVRYAHGVPIESPQLRQWISLVGFIGLVTYAVARS